MTDTSWRSICSASSVGFDRGVAALLDETAIAVFRLSPLHDDETEEWFAVDHADPQNGAPVMARGLVGSTDGGEPMVASPLDKRRYCLATGAALDGSDVRLRTFDVQVVDGLVHVRTDEDGKPVIRSA